jgi:hypothetical protein
VKKLLLLLGVLISIKSFAQTDKAVNHDSLKTTQQVQNQSLLPPLNSIGTITPEQLNNYVGNDLVSYSNQARIGLLMEGGGVVLGLGGAFLSINSVSATPINVSLISGAIITLAGFWVHYDSYRFLKHASRLLKSRKD